jgi:hypothetical protein
MVLSSIEDDMEIPYWKDRSQGFGHVYMDSVPTQNYAYKL